MDSVPLIAITGQVPLKMIGIGPVLMDIHEIEWKHEEIEQKQKRVP